MGQKCFEEYYGEIQEAGGFKGYIDKKKSEIDKLTKTIDKLTKKLLGAGEPRPGHSMKTTIVQRILLMRWDLLKTEKPNQAILLPISLR